MLKEKINHLSNELTVTEEELWESVELGKPFVLSEDQYLTFQSVMIADLRISPKESLNFLNTVLNNIDISEGFENSLYRIYYHYKQKENETDSYNYIKSVFGGYLMNKGLHLINRIDTIEKYKFELN